MAAVTVWLVNYNQRVFISSVRLSPQVEHVVACVVTFVVGVWRPCKGAL